MGSRGGMMGSRAAIVSEAIVEPTNLLGKRSRLPIPPAQAHVDEYAGGAMSKRAIALLALLAGCGPENHGAPSPRAPAPLASTQPVRVPDPPPASPTPASAPTSTPSGELPLHVVDSGKTFDPKLAASLKSATELERAVLIYDLPLGRQHLIHEIAAAHAASQLGVVLAVPTRPEVVNVRGTPFVGLSFAPATPEPKRLTIQADVFRADDAAAVRRWRKRRKAETHPALDRYLAQYARKKYYVVALRSRGGAKAATGLVRISFATTRAFFPYQEVTPSSRRALRLWVIAGSNSPSQQPVAISARGPTFVRPFRQPVPDRLIAQPDGTFSSPARPSPGSYSLHFIGEGKKGTRLLLEKALGPQLRGLLPHGWLKTWMLEDQKRDRRGFGDVWWWLNPPRTVMQGADAAVP